MKRIYLAFSFMPLIYFYFNWRWGIRFFQIHINIFGVDVDLSRGKYFKTFKIKFVSMRRFKIQFQINFRRDLFHPLFHLYITDRANYIGFTGKGFKAERPKIISKRRH